MYFIFIAIAYLRNHYTCSIKGLKGPLNPKKKIKKKIHVVKKLK